MHMRPRPRQEPIVNAGLTAEAFAESLRQRLAPERWPLPIGSLPADTVLVGGAVRDAALGRLDEQPDLDLVVESEAIALGRSLARHHGGTCVVLDAERDMARLVLKGWTIDLARREGPDLSSDLARRDFTVNAIALPLAPGSVAVDPTGGLTHLLQRQLVAVAESNLVDDPLRLLRGVRLAAELNFTIEPTSLRWIERHAPAIAQVAGERVLAELEKLAEAPSGHQGLQQAWALGLLKPWGAQPAEGPIQPQLSPETAHAWGLTPEEVAEALPIARLAWLLDGAAIGQLKGSRRLQQRCTTLRNWWAALERIPLAALPEEQRLALHEQVDADLPALLLGQPAEPCPTTLERWRDAHDPLFHPKPPLDGRDLQQALAIQPSPELGELLRHLKRERAFGRLSDSDPEGAMGCAKQWLASRQPAA
jgi:tRNA nucleotidyltransferase (CCA-adding enzyme)